MIKDTEYMYASAKIRAAEGKDTARIRLERLTECRTVSALLAAVCDLGFLEEGATPVSLEDALRLSLDHAVALVTSAVPDARVYHFMLYKYDCSNLKVALKSSILGKDYDELYFHCGTFSPDGLVKRLSAENFDGIPPHMAQAWQEARKIHATGGEVRSIDLLLDQACFADTSDNVNRYAVPLFRKYTAARADLTNLQTAQRLSSGHMPQETAAALMKRAFVSGGTLTLQQFLNENGYVHSFDSLYENIEDEDLRELLANILAGKEYYAAAFDNYTYRLFSHLRFQPFGVEIPFWFLAIREAEIKNCRLIEAGLYANKKPDEIRERIRAAYV